MRALQITRMQLPKISVVTPSYNQAAFLEQTICSVLGQNYPNLEYFIIDGGSKDGSVEIIRKYEKHLAYWVSEADRGQSHAINKGLQRTTGEIVAYLNSDDIYLPGTFQRIAEAFLNSPDSGLYYGRCRLIDPHGNHLGTKVGSIATLSEILDVWNVWWNERNFVQPEVFWTRAVQDRVGYLREDLFYVMDYEYWVRIFIAGFRSYFVDDDLACFRLHAAQKSTKPEKTAQEMLDVIRPVIWNPSVPIPHKARLAFKGNWTYQNIFLAEVRASLDRGEPRVVRFSRLAAMGLIHPELFAAPNFRGRLFNALITWF